MVPHALVNSGIVHPTAVPICPFVAATTGANSGFGDLQWKSPFDSCPATLAPLSLTNLQVAVGGQNILNSTLNMTYEKFLRSGEGRGVWVVFIDINDMYDNDVGNGGGRVYEAYEVK